MGNGSALWAAIIAGVSWCFAAVAVYELLVWVVDKVFGRLDRRAKNFLISGGPCFSAARDDRSLQQAQTGFLDRNITWPGRYIHYQVYVPADYATKPTWSAILFLHGAGERGDRRSFLPDERRPRAGDPSESVAHIPRSSSSAGAARFADGWERPPTWRSPRCRNDARNSTWIRLVSI